MQKKKQERGEMASGMQLDEMLMDLTHAFACRLLETEVCKGAVRDWYRQGRLSWDRSSDKFLDQNVDEITLVEDGEGNNG